MSEINAAPKEAAETFYNAAQAVVETLSNISNSKNAWTRVTDAEFRFELEKLTAATEHPSGTYKNLVNNLAFLFGDMVKSIALINLKEVKKPEKTNG